MSAALVQLLLCLVAGLLLWRLWRAFDGEDRLIRVVVFLGFIGRAFAGAALFWISWFRLPIARSLQVGDGLWFFALDALLYMPNAASAANKGLAAILTYNRGSASVTYVQSLAIFALLFGIVASVALLLNLFCYLGSCLILTKLRRLTPEARVPGTIAIVAISLSPSAVLWSLQPLKDTLFQFLIIAFMGACVAWQRAWRSRPRAVLLLSIAAVMFVTLYAMGGIRWYFAFSVLCASLAFLVLAGATAAGRKTPAVIAGMFVFATLTQAFVLGARPYPPQRLLDLLSLTKRSGDRRIDALSPVQFMREIRQLRNGFERAGGSTSIGVGVALARLDKTPPPQPAPVTATVASVTPRAKPPATAAVRRDTAPAPVKPLPEKRDETKVPATKASAEPQQAPAVSPQRTETAPGEETPKPATHALPAAATAPPKHAAGAHTTPQKAAAPIPIAPPTPGPATTDSAAPATGTAHSTGAATETAGSEKQPVPQHLAPVESRRSTPQRTARAQRPKTVQAEKSEPAETASVWTPAPVVSRPAAPAPAAPTPPAIVLPESTGARLAAGTIAMVVPRTIASRQGLLDIRGGKGLFWFTDLDTIIFDLVLLIAVGFLLFHIRQATLRNPAFWFIALLVLLVGVPLIYTITNFGTLFRLRMMVYTAAALMPLALAMAGRLSKSMAVESSAAERTAAPTADPSSLPEPQS